MIPVKYGIYSTLIATEEIYIKCPSCESHKWAEAGIYIHYYYFFFIPLFPIYKDLYVVCHQCGLRRNGIPLPAAGTDYLNSTIAKYKHPLFTYTGAILFMGILALVIIFTLLGR